MMFYGKNNIYRREQKMKKRNTFVLIALVLVAVFAFAACSNGGDTSTATEAPAAAEAPAAEPAAEAPAAAAEPAAEEPAADSAGAIRVGYVNKTLNNPYFVALDNALKEEVEARGWEYASLDANEDIAQEAKNMETFVSQGFDCIIMNCIDSQAALAPINEATNAGVPVINVDNAPELTANNVTSVFSDNLNNGRAVGLYVGNTMFAADEEIRAVILSGVKGAVVSQERRTGLFCGIIESRAGLTEDEAWTEAIAFEQELIDNGKATHEAANFTIGGQGWGNWTSDEGLPAMEDLIVANKDMNLALGENDNMLLGAMTAIKNAGLDEQIQIAAAADGQKEAIKLIMDGTNYKATGENSPFKIAKLAIEIANEVISGSKTAADYEAATLTEPNAITPENAADFYIADSPF
jgi:ribose transport system substrate-binding protein